MSESADPLEDAIASVERDQLGGATSAPSDSTGEQQPESEPSSTTSRRGRKRDPNSRRSRAGNYGAGAAGTNGASSGKIEGPPPPPDVRVEFPKMDPAAVAQTIRQLDKMIVKAAGTEPLSTEEAEQGGAVFAPILDFYMPKLANDGGMWLPAFSFVVLAYGPRVYDLIDAAQRRKAGLPPAPSTGALAANPGAAGFSGAAALQDR